jgi:hypothetical protein
MIGQSGFLLEFTLGSRTVAPLAQHACSLEVATMSLHNKQHFPFLFLVLQWGAGSMALVLWLYW